MSTDTHAKRIELPPELQGIDYLTDAMLSKYFTPEEIEQFWHQQLQDLVAEKIAALDYPITDEERAASRKRLGIE
jgi:hypothetical protein